MYFGEVSLSGAIRPVSHTPARLKEAAKLGFARAVVPEPARGEKSSDPALRLTDVGALSSLVADIAACGRPRPAGAKDRPQDG